MSDTNVMVVAGGGGGKSTFIGGLYNAAKAGDGATYTVEMGDRAEINRNILKRMRTKQKYPEKTDNTSVVRIEINGGGTWSSGVTVDFIDIPGEQQQETAEGLIDDIKKGTLDRKAVLKKYREEVRPKMNDDSEVLIAKPGQEDDYDILYKNSYLKSDRVIFVLNLHKVMRVNEQDDEENQLAYDSGALERVANDKPTALVVTALDVLDYDPDVKRDDKGGGWLTEIWDPMTVDSQLHDFLSQNLEMKPQAEAIVDKAEDHPGIDVFGVSVPEMSPDMKHLKSDTYGFQTKGFDEVIKWLRGER